MLESRDILESKDIYLVMKNNCEGTHSTNLCLDAGLCHKINGRYSRSKFILTLEVTRKYYKATANLSATHYFFLKSR